MVVQRTGRGPTTAARRAVTVRGSVNDARRTRWLEAACSVFGHRWTSVRQALQDAIAHERFDRLVVAAARDGSEGLHADIS